MRPWPRTTAPSTLEQRSLASGEGFVDLSHRDVLRIAGRRPPHVAALPHHAAPLDGLAPRTWTLRARPESRKVTSSTPSAGYDDGGSFTAHTEPGAGAALVEWLERMRFMTRVEVSLVDDLAVTWWRPDRHAVARGHLGLRPRCPRDRLTDVRRRGRSGVRPVGLRGAAHRTRRASLSGSTPTSGRSRTRSAGSARRCTSTRAATAARRRSPASTRWVVRRAGS
jgi:hypothetical protein